MAGLLIKYLKEKGAQALGLKPLVNQWGFDEALIPKALQNIAALFPHYSRHDESHSKQILVNIERILGEEGVSQLSATDIWLLLESAYWHDIGMVVSKRDQIDAFSNPAFEDYIRGICDDRHHELYSLAQALKSRSDWMTGAETPIQAVERIQQLMAEWVRKLHPDRAEAIINDPMDRIGVTSPRTELIPHRLFQLLGQICRMHGRPFSEVISNAHGLPFKQAGLGLDDCHPRFVACLLRLGDLLDLDNNRFCPVMQCIAGDDRPGLSKAHEDKHASIRYLRVDRDRIEVKSECMTVEGYIESCDWFRWLKDELRNQMAHWQDIVPSRSLGLLPTLGDLEVSLKGDLQVLEVGKAPKFSVNAQKAFSLLQGSNLYKSKFDFVREVLQNAVDSTLVRFWIEHQAAFSYEGPVALRRALERSSIKVRLTECPVVTNDDTKKRFWRIEISDTGTGVSRHDLPYMMDIGSSNKNRQRRNLIEAMPEWMKPSGSFGIGLQSVFMVSDRIKIDSKDFFSNETILVDMTNPTSASHGAVLIRNGLSDYARKAGATISFEIADDAPRRLTVGLKDTVRHFMAKNFDPLYESSFSSDIAAIADAILNFSKGSIVPVEFEIDALNADVLTHHQFAVPGGDDVHGFDSLKVEDAFCGLTYSLRERNPRSSGLEGLQDRIRVYYRGQKIDNDTFTIFPLIDVGFNILSGDASDWLSVNRSEISTQSVARINKLLVAALEKKIGRDISSARDWPEAKRQHMSLFLAYMAYSRGGGWQRLSSDFGDAWLKLEGFGANLSELFMSDKWVLATLSGFSAKPDLVISRNEERLRSVILNHWKKKRHGSVSVMSFDEAFPNAEVISDDELRRGGRLKDIFNVEAEKDFTGSIFYIAGLGGESTYSQSAFILRMSELIRSGVHNERYVVPYSPLFSKWQALQLKDGAFSDMPSIFPDVPLDGARILLPFLFRKTMIGDARAVEIGDLTSLAEAIADRLMNPLPVREVAALYAELTRFIDELMSESDIWQQRRTKGQVV
ncbi:hypothetical protein [Pseudomonas sp. xss_2]|uniref:HD domain-containing protein n=1 Tax=Pseudomonas sp. xss_2 TaxID=3367215 RepID=UPI00370B6E16